MQMTIIGSNWQLKIKKKVHGSQKKSLFEKKLQKSVMRKVMVKRGVVVLHNG